MESAPSRVLQQRRWTAPESNRTEDLYLPLAASYDNSISGYRHHDPSMKTCRVLLPAGRSTKSQEHVKFEVVPEKAKPRVTSNAARNGSSRAVAGRRLTAAEPAIPDEAIEAFHIGTLETWMFASAVWTGSGITSETISRQTECIPPNGPSTRN